MREPRIVTPHEAEETLRAIGTPNTPYTRDRADWAHTVATEPDRLESAYQTGWRDGRKEQLNTEPERIAAAERAAVVKALRNLAADDAVLRAGISPMQRADAIENGADW